MSDKSNSLTTNLHRIESNIRAMCVYPNESLDLRVINKNEVAILYTLMLTDQIECATFREAIVQHAIYLYNNNNTFTWTPTDWMSYFLEFAKDYCKTRNHLMAFASNVELTIKFRAGYSADPFASLNILEEELNKSVVKTMETWGLNTTTLDYKYLTPSDSERHITLGHIFTWVGDMKAIPEE